MKNAKQFTENTPFFLDNYTASSNMHLDKYLSKVNMMSLLISSFWIGKLYVKERLGHFLKRLPVSPLKNSFFPTNFANIFYVARKKVFGDFELKLEKVGMSRRDFGHFIRLAREGYFDFLRFHSPSFPI